MRVTFPCLGYSEHSLDAKRAAVLDAFSALALASRRTQVAVLTCREVLPLPPFAALKHLILSTPDPADLPITYLEHATSLETMSLGTCGPDFGFYSRRSEEIDVSSLHALKHVRIDNFVPMWLDVPDGCLLHVLWDVDGVHDSEFEAWARDMQLLWEGQSMRLGSLQICFQDEEWHSYNMAALRTMLTGDQELAFISLCSPELGNEEQPFFVDPSSCQMLALAERVRFRCGKACSISVTGMQPKWKDLSIDAAKVNLQVENTAALVRGLDNFWIDAIAVYGSTSLSMMLINR
ncbi:hypothetical protein CVIRNUC_005694 [Coccomyxa viridis]|uniref:Uncharacterized protein n=1 Tax=Coccomyxa viridis TaxID=1274662 RepID=A0AAV1I600_9CHLO|nr:hypothetical protein CVIRNUC_005694 [Coccomyxa viridis]